VCRGKFQRKGKIKRKRKRKGIGKKGKKMYIKNSYVLLKKINNSALVSVGTSYVDE
jgi:hypothetical protein